MTGTFEMIAVTDQQVVLLSTMIQSGANRMIKAANVVFVLLNHINVVDSFVSYYSATSVELMAGCTSCRNRFNLTSRAPLIDFRIHAIQPHRQ